MKVKVIPKKPIPGILPKNKFIDMEMELDLNKNEIAFCMQYGNVFDMEGNLIDRKYLEKVHKSINEEKRYMDTLVIYTSDKVFVPKNIYKGNEKIADCNTKLEKDVVEKIKSVIEPEVSVVKGTITESDGLIHVEEQTEATEYEDNEPFCNLLMSSCVKEDEYILLEFINNADSVLKGNLYGLLNIISGPRPTLIEYKFGEEWRKFSTKFDNFEELKKDDKIIFRIIPKNENKFTCRVSIKENNAELDKVEWTVDPANL